uniref:Somatolactin alpha n=1 Tax=Hucho hucho TaxID=62062 RepID=A0A4W5NPA4_9TELE
NLPVKLLTNQSKTFSEPPYNQNINIPRTGKIFISVLRTYGFVPRTNGKPKMYFPTTSKEPNVLEEMFIPFHVRIPLTQTGNACTTSTLSIHTSRSEVQENSDKWLLHSILFLIKFWIDPLVNLQTSLDRYDNAPMALINKTKWISGKLMNLAQGVTILIQKMLGEGNVMLEQNNKSLADYPVHFDMLESVLRDYTLLACFKKDTHKMETFLKLLKCRRKGGLGCSLL